MILSDHADHILQILIRHFRRKVQTGRLVIRERQTYSFERLARILMKVRRALK